MAVKVVPTRGNLFKLVRKLKMAQKGHGLLEQKRQILMLELSSTIAKARRVQKEVSEVFQEAYAALQRANISLGVETVEEIAHSIPEERRFVIRLRSVMGVEVPEVDPLEPKADPAYSFLETSSSMDEAYLAFCKVRSILSQLAEVENAVYRLAVQVRRTNRRVNALEKIIIPMTQALISEIASVLEESEREDFVRMKTAKKQKIKREG